MSKAAVGSYVWVLMVRTTGFGDWLHSYEEFPTERAALAARPERCRSAYYAKRFTK